MTTGPEAGYYADPSIPGYIRYWDGAQWVAGTSRPAPTKPEQRQSADVWTPEPSAPVRPPPQPSVPPQPPSPIRSPSQAHAQAQVQAQAQALQRTPILPLDPIEGSGLLDQPVRTQPVRTSPVRTSPPAVARPPFREPDPEPELEPSDAEPLSVATMVVPSAFVNAGAYSQGWGGPGPSAGSPFAGLPGFTGVPDPAEQEESESRVETVKLASPGSRLLAKIIDLFLAVLMSSPATATLLLVAHRHDHQYVENLRLKATESYTTLGMDGTGIALWALAAASLILVALLYEAFRVGAGGQTTGRRLVGIRVVRAGTAGRFSTGSALVRGVLFWVLLIVPVVDVLALGPIVWGRPYRQGLHDKLTRAVTVRVS